jgi:hypothetical protein
MNPQKIPKIEDTENSRDKILNDLGRKYGFGLPEEDLSFGNPDLTSGENVQEQQNEIPFIYYFYMVDDSNENYVDLPKGYRLFKTREYVYDRDRMDDFVQMTNRLLRNNPDTRRIHYSLFLDPEHYKLKYTTNRRNGKTTNNVFLLANPPNLFDVDMNVDYRFSPTISNATKQRITLIQTLLENGYEAVPNEIKVAYEVTGAGGVTEKVIVDRNYNEYIFPFNTKHIIVFYPVQRRQISAFSMLQQGFKRGGRRKQSRRRNKKRRSTRRRHLSRRSF